MPTDTPVPLPFAAAIALAGLGRDERPVRRALTAGECADLARFLDIPAVERLAFEGRLLPWGPEGWRLTGGLDGAVVQRCVVTLEPVPETVATELERRYAPANGAEPAETLEIGPEDLEPPEPLGAEIDLAAAMVESLALALEPYPRHPDAAFAGRVHAGPGITPLTDEALHPFARLGHLRERLDPDGNGGT